MSRTTRGLIIAALHVMLVASLGGKMLYDRATLPRVWARAAPYDPSLPIRGRYVSLQLVVDARGVQEPPSTPGQARWPLSKPVALKVQNGRLIAEPNQQTSGYDSSTLLVHFIDRGGEKLTVLYQPVAFFIPEHVDDPSRRPQGEELWVEVTVPPKGSPRPIRLGVKKGDAQILPLDFN